MICSGGAGKGAQWERAVALDEQAKRRAPARARQTCSWTMQQETPTAPISGQQERPAEAMVLRQRRRHEAALISTDVDNNNSEMRTASWRGCRRWSNVKKLHGLIPERAAAFGCPVIWRGCKSTSYLPAPMSAVFLAAHSQCFGDRDTAAIVHNAVKPTRPSHKASVGKWSRSPKGEGHNQRRECWLNPLGTGPFWRLIGLCACHASRALDPCTLSVNPTTTSRVSSSSPRLMVPYHANVSQARLCTVAQRNSTTWLMCCARLR